MRETLLLDQQVECVLVLLATKASKQGRGTTIKRSESARKGLAQIERLGH